MKTQRCKVIRAFMMDGKPVKVGTELPISIGFATELRTANKVEFIADAPPPVEAPKPAAVVQPPSDPPQGKNKGGK